MLAKAANGTDLSETKANSSRRQSFCADSAEYPFGVQQLQKEAT
jgi:hypothetical protein